MGTVDYMAPEQALNPRKADRRADVYSLGGVLTFLLTGQPPYQGATPMERLVAHREQPIPTLAPLLGTPPRLDSLLQRLLAKTPRDRFESMHEVIRALRTLRLSPHGEMAASDPSGVTKPAARIPPKSWWILAGCLFAGVGLFLGWTWFLGKPAPIHPTSRDEPSGATLQLLWEAGEPLGHEAMVTGVAFLRDGRRGVSCADDGAFCFWDLAQGKPAPPGKITPDVGPNTLAVHPDGLRLLSGHDDGSVRLWPIDAPGPRKWDPWFGHEKKLPVFRVAISADGRFGLSGSKDGSVRRWNLVTNQAINPLLTANDTEITAVALAPQGFIGLVGGNGALRYWDLAAGKLQGEWDDDDHQISSVVFLPDGRSALCTCWEQRVFLLDLVSQQDQWGQKGHDKWIYQVALSPGGRRAVTAGGDGLIVVWDVAAGTIRGRHKAHEGDVLCVAFSSDGKQILSGGQDRKVRLWQLGP